MNFRHLIGVIAAALAAAFAWRVSRPHPPTAESGTWEPVSDVGQGH